MGVPVGVLVGHSSSNKRPIAGLVVQGDPLVHKLVLEYCLE